MRHLLFALPFALAGALSSHAQDSAKSIDDLLTDYRVASDLSNQTRQESGGSVIVFTRVDLEKMKAYNLRDILKTVPMMTLQEIATGPVGLAQAGGATFNTQVLKLYVNDHELGSVVFGSAMKMWGYLDIGHIDHIELYQTGSAVSSGDEPPGMVVKLYTKDPSRDSGGQLQGVYGSRGSNELNAYYAGSADSLSYFLYADRHDEQRTPVAHASGEARRDFSSYNLFGSVAGESFRVDFGRFDLYHDGFFGLGRMQTPRDNYNDLDHMYVDYTHYFQHKSLKLNVAYDRACHIRYDNDPGGIALNDGTVAQEWYYDKDEAVFETSVSKELRLGSHTVETGLQYKSKQYLPSSLEIDGTERKDDIADYRLSEIYSLFFSDDIAFGEEKLLFGTFKYDYHRRNGGMDDLKNYVARVGYICNKGEWLWKSFAVHTYGHPVFLQDSYFPFVAMQNPELKAEDRRAATTELQLRRETTTTGLRLLYTRVENHIVLDQQMRYVNSEKATEFYALYASHEHRFDSRNKLSISAYTTTNTADSSMSPRNGGYLQLFNGWGDFDLYNELLYRSGFDYDHPMARVEVDAGYDYTAALTYHLNDDASLSLKGENLLERAIETPYVSGRGAVYATPTERTVRLAVRYLF